MNWFKKHFEFLFPYEPMDMDEPKLPPWSIVTNGEYFTFTNENGRMYGYLWKEKENAEKQRDDDRIGFNARHSKWRVA